MMRALIIEPEAIVAMFIEEELRELGFTDFDWAASQAAAVAMAGERTPDLITAENMLDAGTGVGAVREICALKSIPTIFIVTNHHAMLSIIPGAVVLEKPFHMDDFRAAVLTAQQIVNETNLMFWQVNSHHLSSY